MLVFCPSLTFSSDEDRETKSKDERRRRQVMNRYAKPPISYTEKVASVHFRFLNHV